MPIREQVRASGQGATAPNPVPLSPWPETSAERAQAVARLRKAVAGRTDDDDEAASALGEAASELVEREAPGAPQAIRDEATIRLAGYLAGSDFGGIASEQGGPGGHARIEHVTNHAAAFRNSGAKGLLSPWKVRRAGAI